MPVARRSWDLAGRLSVTAEDVDAAQREVLDAELDPFDGVDGAPAAASDVELHALALREVREVQGPARDGRTTAVDRDGRLLVRCGTRWAEVPAPDGSQRLGLEPGLALGACWKDLVRPVLHTAVRQRGAVAVHGAAVGGGPTGGTLVCGWSESGKTEVALALVEAGASFLSDKWTVLGEDAQLSAFPVGVGVRGWALPALPRLRATLPPGARAQLHAAAATRTLLGSALERAWTGRVTSRGARAAGRAVELGDRVGLSPSALRRAYGQTDDPARRVDLETVVLLLTGPAPRVSVATAEPQDLADRLARTAAYERRAYDDLQERGAYAGLPGRAGARERAVAEEADRLSRVLGRAGRLLLVTCPFPGDPRRVVDAVAAAA